jgi:RHS repeat-associated protein
MKSASGKATYAYDGLGHRFSMVGADGVNRINVYSQEGQLLYVKASNSAVGTTYVYVHRHVLAEVNGGSATYDHTDGLGSPVAQTNASGALLNRTRYEPYGAVAAGNTGTIGFTGHVNDNDTGLVYMQQRYYDPVAGRFLSIDPVTTDARSGRGFNRYAYAVNNPYAYVDPDGRESQKKEPDKRDRQIEEELRKQRERCQINCSIVTYQSTYDPNDVRGGFNDRGQSLVYHPDVYDPETASEILIFGATTLLPELFFGKAIIPAADFFAGTRYTYKVLAQMKHGDFHAFPEGVKAFQGSGIRSTIRGGDGVMREMLRIPGGYRGKLGYFEFIKEADGAINHRLFKALSE